MRAPIDFHQYPVAAVIYWRTRCLGAGAWRQRHCSVQPKHQGFGLSEKIAFLSRAQLRG